MKKFSVTPPKIFLLQFQCPRFFYFFKKNTFFGSKITFLGTNRTHKDLINTSFNKVRLFTHVIMIKHLSTMMFFLLFWLILKGNSEREFRMGIPKGNFKGNSHWDFRNFSKIDQLLFLKVKFDLLLG